jgi:hypothetical protein
MEEVRPTQDDGAPERLMALALAYAALFKIATLKPALLAIERKLRRANP